MSGPLDFDDRDEDGRRERAPGGPDAAAGRDDDLPPAPPPAKPVGASRYTWFLGVVGFLLVVVVTINSIGSEGVDSGGPNAGDRLVPFAVPLATAPSRPDEDANVDRRKACGVRGPGIVNVCQRAERGPVVLALFPTDAGRCRSVVGQFQRIASQFPGVAFMAVGSEGDRSELARIAREAPAVEVGWDRDRAVAAVYGIVGCPQVSFARRGGPVELTTRRQLSDSELAGRVRELTR